VCALVVAGCASDPAVESAVDTMPPAASAPASTTTSTTITVPSITVPSVTTIPTVSTTAGPLPSPTVSPSSLPPSSAVPPTTSVLPVSGPVDEADADGLDETVDPLGEVVYDDPTFDIGPQVDIDIDLARFPVDDAGIGGGAPEPGAPDEPHDTPLTGWAAVDRHLESVLVVPGNTAAALAVSIGGDVVHTAAFGERDPSTGDPAEPHDRFRIASISKPITAIVAMTLVEDGVVGLDDPIGGVLAEHVGLSSVSSGAQQLTLRRLLSHRSGFGKYESTFFRSGADDCTDAARQGLARGVGGGGYIYSNMNYCLAGLLIEALTGLTYEQAAYQQLLTPLGISGMRLAPTFDPGPDEIQHQTTDGRNYMETLGGAGSWIASPTDLVTILDSLDLSTSGFKPLDQSTVFQMAIPVGGQYGQRGYGLGLISYGDGRFGHTGTIESTHAMLLNRGDGVTWALTVAGQSPSESTALEQIMNRAFEAGGFVTG
jgi:D-alanyl-D-alanine carboxypeptidase